MIDIELDVYDACARRVLDKYPDCLTSSMNVYAPASFPAVSISEAGNRLDVSRCDSSGRENAAIVEYDVQVFSNLKTGARSQAKKLLQIVDEYLTSMNFRRTVKTQGESAKDPSIYRITARYTASVDKSGKISRR